MPFYEYQCSACGDVSEVMQKISDPPLAQCPRCGRKRLQKLVSAPVFRLKGAGWYETDFKGDKDNRRNLAGAEQESEAKPAGEAQGESKGESKGEAKGEAKGESAKPADTKADASPALTGAAAKGKSTAQAAKPVARPAAARRAAVKKKARR